MSYSNLDEFYETNEHNLYEDERSHYGQDLYDIDSYDKYGDYNRQWRMDYGDQVYGNSSNFTMRSNVPEELFHRRWRPSFDSNRPAIFRGNCKRQNSFEPGYETLNSFNHRQYQLLNARKQLMRKYIAKAHCQSRNRSFSEDEYAQDSDDDDYYRLPPEYPRDIMHERPRQIGGSSAWVKRKPRNWRGNNAYQRDYDSRRKSIGLRRKPISSYYNYYR